MEAAVTEMTKDYPGIVKVRALGKLSTKCKIIFDDSGHMWNLLKRMKGQKFSYQGNTLRHEMETTKEKQDIAVQTSIAVFTLSDFGLEKGWYAQEDRKKNIDGDWNIGHAFRIVGGKAKKVLVRDRKSGTWATTEIAGEFIPGFDFNPLLERLNNRP